MKMRKLFAGIAAAATLLGSMAMGAVSAQAEDTTTPAPVADGTLCTIPKEPSDKTITINADDYRALITADGDNPTPRAFKVVKLASYETHGTGENGAAPYQLSVKTEDDVKTAIIAALGTAYKAEYGDPMEWVSLNHPSDETTRNLADALATSLSSSLAVPTETEFHKGTDGTAGSVTLTLSDPGVYLVVDGSGTVTIAGNQYTASKSLIAATKVNGEGNTNTTCIVGGDGVINIKNTHTEFGDFGFTKTKADGTALAGAKFVIQNKGGQYGYYTEPTWTWKAEKPDTTKDQTSDGIFVSGADGVVKFPKLPAGDYTVTEVVVPTGYIQQFVGTFNLTVTYDESGQLSYKVTSQNDTWGLVSGTGDKTNGFTGDVKVKNVQNITQLPHTGAAGTIMYSAIGVLLAGAAITICIKSRSTKRALMH